MTGTILITGAGSGGANNLIRSIRKGALPVRIVGSNADRFTLGQSLADSNYLIPRGDDKTSYLEAIRKIVKQEKIDLIVPDNDTEIFSISSIRDEIDAKVFLPQHETVRICQDKFLLSSLLNKNGFRVARTHEINNPNSVDEVFKHFQGEPVVWIRMRKGSGSQGSLPVSNSEQARSWIKYWNEMRNVPENVFIASEYLPGRDYAFQSLWQDGNLVIAKTCQRLTYIFARMMPSGTSSSPQIGKLVNNSQVNDICTRAVKSIDPHATGMFCIDLKEAEDGTPCITEINIGRFFMITIVFNITGKYNMAELYLRLALGEKVIIPEDERYSDIDGEERFLIRDIDNEPTIINLSDLEKKYISLLPN